MYIVKHSSACVCLVGCKDFSAGQLPHKPGIYRAEKQFAPLRRLASSVYIVKYPLDFCSAEICVNFKSCCIRNIFFKSLRLKFFAYLRGSAALPDNSVIYRLAGKFIPNHNGFTLIGNTHRANIRRGKSRFYNTFAHSGILRR